MKLSDIKGEKALDIMADAMELAELVGCDARFKALMDDMRAARDEDGESVGSATWKAFCRNLPPILRDQRYKDRIVSILAAASGVTAEEYAVEGPVLADLFELLTSDSESLGFLLGSAAPRE